MFCLETTGFSCNFHDIIEICATSTDLDGTVLDMEVAMFHSLVKPPIPNNLLITGGIAGTSNETIVSAPSFQECGTNFITFLKK
jgi:DNA polymerase III alpha subunit (gram-positive type)